MRLLLFWRKSTLTVSACVLLKPPYNRACTLVAFVIYAILRIF
jgi:hypothetical protein